MQLWTDAYHCHEAEKPWILLFDWFMWFTIRLQSDIFWISKQKHFCFVPKKNNFLNGLEKLYDSIELYQKHSKDKIDSQLPLQSTISSKASTLFRESLKIVQLRYVQCGSDLHIMHGDLELLMTQRTFIFEISVRLAMISSKYSFPTKSTEEMLYSALNKFGEILSWIKELSFVRHTEMKVTEMSLPMSSTQS